MAQCHVPRRLIEIRLEAAVPDAGFFREQIGKNVQHQLFGLTAELDTLDDISGDIAAAICDEPPFSVREGGIIRDGFNEEVDRLRHILKSGKGVMAEMEAKEKEKTGIRIQPSRLRKARAISP